MRNYVLSPSILAADFKVLGQEMKKTEENGAAYIHFDVMDGMFVPSISFGMPVLASIHDATEQFMDAHLMVQEPIRYVEAFQMILIMSVQPGFGGQKFIPESLDKIREVRAMLNEKNLETDIQVDGGIYVENVREVLDAGANVIVAGSAVFRGDAGENTAKFMEILKSYE